MRTGKVLEPAGPTGAGKRELALERRDGESRRERIVTGCVQSSKVERAKHCGQKCRTDPARRRFGTGARFRKERARAIEDRRYGASETGMRPAFEKVRRGYSRIVEQVGGKIDPPIGSVERHCAHQTGEGEGGSRRLGGAGHTSIRRPQDVDPETHQRT